MAAVVAAAAATAAVLTEVVLMPPNRKSFVDLLVLLALQDLLDTREKLELLELQVILEDQAHKDFLENPEHPVTPDQKEQQAITAPQGLPVNQATTERKEHLATMAHPVYLEALVFLAKTDTMELRGQRDQKAKLGHKVTLSRRKFLGLLVHLATPVKMENQDTMVVPALLAPLALLDLMDLPANLAPMAIPADRDLKGKLDFLAMTVPLVKMEFLVLPAKFQGLQDHLDLLVLLATMVLLAKMDFPALLVIRARTENLDTQEAQVQFRIRQFPLPYQHN
jgi:hypothetical protein